MERESLEVSQEVQNLQKEYCVLKSSAGNFRCHKCLIVDGYSVEEERCRWCKELLYEIDKI